MHKSREKMDTCPGCGSRDVTGQSYDPDTDDGVVRQELSCDDCGGNWVAVYRFFHTFDFTPADVANNA